MHENKNSVTSDGSGADDEPSARGHRAGDCRIGQRALRGERCRALARRCSKNHLHRRRLELHARQRRRSRQRLQRHCHKHHPARKGNDQRRLLYDQNRRSRRLCGQLRAPVRHDPSPVHKAWQSGVQNCTNLRSITIKGDLLDASGNSTRSDSTYNPCKDYSVFYNTGTNMDAMTVTFSEGVTRVPAYIFATSNGKSANNYSLGV